MPLTTSIPGPLKKGGRTLLFGVAGFLLSGLVCAGGLRAQDTQDAAEAARAEQARKAAKPKSARHVYTDDDLKRAQILTPEDQAKVAARKNNPTEKNGEQAKAGGESAPVEESLGEVARRYRKEKEEQESARLSGQGNRAGFALKLPEAAMAAPKPLVQPKTEARPMGNPQSGIGAGRVSPFAPRPLPVAPSEPVVPRRAEAPGGTRGAEVRVPTMMPSAPKVGVASGMVARKVERGDSWWKLAENYLGSGARWRELRGMNPAGRKPADWLLLGSTVLVPAEVVGHEAAVAKSVTVQKGDTLWSMARKHMGHGAAWKCLAEANPELGEPRRLQIGARVRLPAGGIGSGCEAGAFVKVKN